MNANSIVNLIDIKQEQIEMVKKRKQATQTVQELLNVGFEQLGEKIEKYTIDREDYRDIYETGNVLVYKGIILAVSDNGIYVHALVDIEENMELKFYYHIDFGIKQYDSIYSIINKLLDY